MQNTLIAEPTEVILRESKSFRSTSLDYKRPLRKPQEKRERQVAWGASTPDSLHHVAQAAETLAGPHGTAREKLIKAGGQFWAAMRYRYEWTPELLDTADPIWKTLFAEGTIETTVRKMNPETAARTAVELAATMARLAADIAIARAGNQLPSQQNGFQRPYV
jgi:hypothetical protein